MAHINERLYLEQFFEKWPLRISGRVLNVGAAVGDTDWASLFPDRALVSVDQQAGDHVDVTCDLTGDCTALQGEQFAAILCCSVLEHCKKPWLMAAHLVQHLKDEGLIYVTVPWIWRFHPYPSDYWRLSIEGVRELFAGISWKRAAYATQAKGEFRHEGQPHDDGEPWRQFQGPRVLLCSQFVCMIGRKIPVDAPKPEPGTREYRTVKA